MARVNAVACSQLQGVGTRGVGSDVAVNVARLWGAGRSALSTHYGYGNGNSSRDGGRDARKP